MSDVWRVEINPDKDIFGQRLLIKNLSTGKFKEVYHDPDGEEELVLDVNVMISGPFVITSEKYTELPERNSNNLIVLGSGPTVEEDLVEFKSHKVKKYDVMAVNSMALKYTDKIDHLISLHPEHIPTLVQQRIDAGLDSTFYTHSRNLRHHADYSWRDLSHMRVDGGFFGLVVGKGLGYKKLFCIGMSMIHEPNGHPFNHMILCMEKYKDKSDLIPYLGNSVKSFSGNTKKWFGKPHKGWVDEEDD